MLSSIESEASWFLIHLRWITTRNASSFYGEIFAIQRAAEQLKLLKNKVAHRWVVFLVDSQGPTTSLSKNTPTDCPLTIGWWGSLSEMLSGGWNIILQGILSHVGIPWNERAEQLASKGLPWRSLWLSHHVVGQKHQRKICCPVHEKPLEDLRLGSPNEVVTVLGGSMPNGCSVKG